MRADQKCGPRALVQDRFRLFQWSPNLSFPPGRFFLRVKIQASGRPSSLTNKKILRLITAIPARRHELRLLEIFVVRRV
jgi:hypothetical protein